MINYIFAVCDLEPAYAYNFMEFMNGKKNTPFEVQAFTNTRILEKFCKDTHVEVLLISNKAMNDLVKEMNIGKIFILSEGDILPELAQYPTVYKYQSSDNIIAEVMSYYAQAAVQPEAAMRMNRSKRIDIIGVYSPINRSLKTSFAITLGQILAKDKNSLYINLEEYSGLATLLGMDFTSNLSDLMYFIRQKTSNIIVKMNGMLQNIENLDFIPPVSTPKDLRSVTFEEWNWLLDEIISRTLYEVIIIDFGDSVDEVLRLMDRCRRIYMPIREDVISQAKIEQFDNMLVFGKMDSLASKIKKLKLPYHNSFGAKEVYIEQLIWGELGDYVRKLIYEERC